jgi:hypothetical protein
LQRKRALTDSTALTDVVNELVNTERSYVKRLRILKNDYADPLRQFSRNKNTAILPSYEAKTLFGNIDNFLPVNEAFLSDLEKMVAPDGPETVGGVGDVALRHFKDLRGFEHYRQYYVKREEAQSIFEREMMKKSSGFAAYVDVSVDATLLGMLTRLFVSSGSSIRTLIPGIALVCASYSWTLFSGFRGIRYSFAP